MRALVWFRGDLRVADNPALIEATEQATEGVIALFLLAPTQWKEHDWGNKRVSIVLRHLAPLKEQLEALKIPLLVRLAPHFDDATEALLEVMEAHECQALFANKEYELNERRRDQKVEQALEEKELKAHWFDDQLLLPPGSVLTQEETPYKVFTPFKKEWIKELDRRGGPPSPLSASAQSEMPCQSDDLPDELEGYDLSDCREDLWPAGEEHAHERLEQFATYNASRYQDRRDTPSVRGTSMLSPYLTVGALSAKQCLNAIVEQADTPWPDLALQDTEEATWISELIWREFYRHLIVAFPRLCMYRPFRLETEDLPWRDSDADFEAWCEGRTGYPIIDAAIKQLLQTGWMHNRLRMIVAMFLTKHLLIDWRKGEKFFMEHLVDGDLASNNGGWQWAASTGTDAAPYFRVFNPWSQSERYDPEGKFIKRFLPELEDVKAKALHDPKKLAKVRPDAYPAPICEHSSARKRAIETFKALK